MSKISFLGDSKVTTKTVLHDALDRATDDDICMVIWMGADNELHWSCNTKNIEALWMLEKMKANIV